MTITAVMCTRNRTNMALQAMRCWEQQTHANKRLYIFDNSDRSDLTIREVAKRLDAVYEFAGPQRGTKLNTIMNMAMARALANFPTTSFLAKWDDDDLSHPQRMAVQLDLSQRTGKLVVGFNELPFYNSLTGEVLLYRNPVLNYVVGTTLMIGKDAWKVQQFPDTVSGRGSDSSFVTLMAGRMQVIGVSGCNGHTPMMVARWHGANTTPQIRVWKKATNVVRDAVLDMVANA